MAELTLEFLKVSEQVFQCFEAASAVLLLPFNRVHVSSSFSVLPSDQLLVARVAQNMFAKQKTSLH